MVRSIRIHLVDEGLMELRVVDGVAHFEITSLGVKVVEEVYG